MTRYSFKIGFRVRWSGPETYEVDDNRVARNKAGATETPVLVAEGVTGTVVEDGDEIRVVIDEVFRATGEVDEVVWSGVDIWSAKNLAGRVLEVIGTEECPGCGNTALDSDYKNAAWTLYCTYSEGDVCGFNRHQICVAHENLSEEARLAAKAAIEADQSTLKRIHAILGHAGEWCGCHEGDMYGHFDAKADVAVLSLLAMIREGRDEAVPTA